MVVLNFIRSAISPVTAGVTYLLADEPPALAIEFVTLLSLLGVFLLVGLVAEHTPGKYLSKRVHAVMETIPGVSTGYESVRRASRLLVDDDTDQFQDVKLVEFPTKARTCSVFSPRRRLPSSKPARTKTRW